MASKSRSGKKSSSLAAHSGPKDRKSARFRENKAKDEIKELLAFKVLSPAHTKELAELETVEQVQEKMCEILNLSQCVVDLKEAAVLDYYTGSVWWSKEQQFTQEQMSAFYTVIHTLLENIKEKHMGLVDNLKEYKKMLVGIGIDNAETSGGLDCFDVLQAKNITDHLNQSLFQHYKMYEFMFSHTQAEEIIGTDLSVEVAPAADVPWPAPLEEGVVDGIHKGYIATPVPTPVEEIEDEKLTNGGGDTEGTSGEEGSSAEGAAGDASLLLAQLTPEEVKAIMKSVMDEMVTGLQNEVGQKLREKENAVIQRINKIHKLTD